MKRYVPSREYEHLTLVQPHHRDPSILFLRVQQLSFSQSFGIPPVDRIVMSYQGNTWVAIRYGAGRFRRRRSIPGWGRIIEAILVDVAEIGNSEAFGEQRKETGKSQSLTRSCVGHGPIERADGAGPIRGQRAGTLPLRGLRTVNREFVWTHSQ